MHENAHGLNKGPSFLRGSNPFTIALQFLKILNEKQLSLTWTLNSSVLAVNAQSLHVWDPLVVCRVLLYVLNSSKIKETKKYKMKFNKDACLWVPV